MPKTQSERSPKIPSRAKYTPSDLEEGDRVRLFINYNYPDVVDVREGVVLSPNCRGRLRIRVSSAGRVERDEINLSRGPYRSSARQKRIPTGRCIGSYLILGNLGDYTRNFQYDTIRFIQIRQGRRWAGVEPASS